MCFAYGIDCDTIERHNLSQKAGGILMLIPILGRAGSGKTTYIINKIKEIAGKKKVLLIVPEQFSFEMEKTIYRSIEPKNAVEVEVYSFTRFCRKIFSLYGGIAGEVVSDAAKHILMSLALDRIKDSLTLYQKPALSIAFVNSMIETVEEFKNAGVDPERLNQFAATTDDVQLGQKTSELSEIYQYYQSLIESGYQDEKDCLLKCCAILEGKQFFQDYTIFIDSFMTFMAGEKKLIDMMLQECVDLYVTLPCDNLRTTATTDEDTINGYYDNGTFDTSKETGLQLIANAHRFGVPVGKPVYLTCPYRFQEPGLQHMEQWITSTKKLPFEGKSDAIHFIQAVHPYDEIQFVAAEIINLVKKNKIRYRDIAVIARSVDLYETAIEDVFQKYSIPIFMDMREDIQSIPVVAFVMAALDAVKSNFDTQYMLALGKSSLMGLDYTKVAQVENYCYTWNVNHTQWINGEGFQNNPRGLEENFTDNDRALLAEIQETARAITEPVQKLKDQLSSCTGGLFAQHVYQFLLDVNAPYNMEHNPFMKKEGFERYLTLNRGAWDILIDLFDLFYHTMENIKLPLERFIELFKLGIQCSDLGSIPNTLDQVLIGTADRMRPNHPKVTFVIGMNQGEFPLQLSEYGLFSDIERDELMEGGIQLNPSVIKRSNYEKYFTYAALTSPSEQLFVSYHSALLTGELTPKSPIFNELEELFPDNVVSTVDMPIDFYIANDKTAFEALCRSIRKKDDYTAALYQHVKETKYQAELEKILLILQKGGFRIQSREISRMLFGKNMKLSPSRVENYFLCPFSYFCAGGLNLRARKKVEFSPLQSGTIIHYILEQAVSKHGGKGLGMLSESEIRGEVKLLLEEYLQDRITQQEALTKRFQYLFARLTNTLTRLLIHLSKEFAQSEFEPIGFETPIKKDSGIKPLELKTMDGTTVYVEGIVDRLDIMEKNGEKYVRVVDYKSGSKVFQLEDIYYGLNLQMLIYLFSIWENGQDELENAVPAGVLYMPAKDSIVSTERNTSEEEVEQIHMKCLKMNGLLLADPTVLSGMEKGLGGVFIPAKTKKDGNFDQYSSVATLAQLGKMKDYIEKTLIDMAENLSDGKIEALPVNGLGYEPCKYCDFKTICQHQEDDPKQTLKSIKKEAFFNQIEQI